MSRTVTIRLTARNVAIASALLLLAIGGTIGAAAAVARGGRSPASGEIGASAHGEANAGEHAEHAHEEGRVTLSPAAIRNAGLELAAAAPGEVNVTLALPGEVSLNADAVAHVTPRVGGTVREVRKQIGDVVKKGDLLAILDSRELAEAQREFLATKERLALAESNFARAEMLQKEKISAEKDYLAAKQALAEARIDHRSAAQKLAAVGGSGGGGGSSYALVAPFAGTIIEKHISVGEVLRDDTQAFIIADLSTIWVNVTVYAKDLPRVRVGQPAVVRAEGIAEPAEGSLVYLGQVVGEQTRSATARVVLQNPGASWRPGLFATADVTIDRVSAAVVVTDDAVQTVEGKEVVFVQAKDAFEARAVKLGRKGRGPRAHEGHLVEIVEGLAPGERYVAKNGFVLKAELGKAEAGHED